MMYLGIKRFAKKDGSGFCHMIQYAGPFSDREVQAGSIGLKVFETFISEGIFKALASQGPSILNKEFIFDFEMNTSGRAEICGVRFREK